MLDQAPENGGFQFRSGFVVDRHGRDPARLFPSILISGGNCHRFYHIGAQKGGRIGLNPASRIVGKALSGR
jgi:hypothetical protein